MQTVNGTNSEIQISQLQTHKAEDFLVIEGVNKIYPTADGPYTVLDGVNLKVRESEFVCIIGHSGCGKSTLLNMVSGFNTPTDGVVMLQNKPITEPGPDRMMVFQNYCLLPWLSVFDNIYLAVDTVFPRKTQAEKRAIVKEHLAMVGLTEAADKKPSQISG
ncbi:ABC transporter ATP-binding protein, partial [Fischerella thermalis]